MYECVCPGVVELVVVGIWILGLALFPILIIWLNTESFLLLIQQDPCVARFLNPFLTDLIEWCPFVSL